VVGAFGLATLRRDGFVSIDAEEEPGFVLTKPLAWAGGDLLVNVDHRRMEDAHPRHQAGWLAAEITDADGELIEGFSQADCIRVAQNTERDGCDCYLPVRWAPDRSLARLAGRTIRIRFVLKDARLYAFKAGAAVK
jgi:hypothetical protein